MKARFFKKVSFGLALSAMPFVGACNQQTSNSPQSLVTAAQAEPSAATATNTVAFTGDLAGPTMPTSPETTPPPAENAPVPAPAPNSGKTLPPSIKPSSPVGEVVKLAQSGVDEAVMLSYVNNSASMFNLASDEIIYLNDIGTPNSVVTAMIQRDQALKQSWTDAAQAQNATAQANAQAAQAAAPTYVNPPEPEAQPATADAAPPQQPANVTYNYFYDSLSPYGSWIEIDGYGRCWQPTVVVVNRGWRPYCDRGRWLYTDAGWYWNSDYSWGATTFHYGRWFNHTRWGWCWYPDRVWGPSWVSWRYSNDYCGWAPLLPSIRLGIVLAVSSPVFVPTRHFCDPHPWRYRLPHHEEVRAFRETTAIENIRHDRGRFINPGIAPERISAVTKTEIRTVSIRETRNADHGTRGERLERDGRTLVVRRPNIPQSAGDTTASPRHLRDSQSGRTPVAGAGAAAQVETPRSRGSDRAARTPPGTPPTVSSPRLAEGRTATQSPPTVSGNTRATIPAARPTPSGGAAPRGRDERPNNLNRDRNRDNNRPETTPPLIVQSGERIGTTPSARAPQSSTTVNTPTAQKPPSGSLVVIGRRDSNPGQSRTTGNERRSTSARTETPARSTHTWSATQFAPPSQPAAAAPQVQTPRASATTPPALLSYNRPPPQAPRYERHEAPRQVTPLSRTYSAPTPVAPSPRPQSVAPTFSAPRSMPAPSHSMPTYSAPRSSPAPAPSYTPAPSRAPAAAPAQARSQSGRDGSSRRNRN